MNSFEEFIRRADNEALVREQRDSQDWEPYRIKLWSMINYLEARNVAPLPIFESLGSSVLQKIIVKPGLFFDKKTPVDIRVYDHQRLGVDGWLVQPDTGEYKPEADAYVHTWDAYVLTTDAETIRINSPMIIASPDEKYPKLDVLPAIVGNNAGSRMVDVESTHPRGFSNRVRKLAEAGDQISFLRDTSILIDPIIAD